MYKYDTHYIHVYMIYTQVCDIYYALIPHKLINTPNTTKNRFYIHIYTDN